IDNINIGAAIYSLTVNKNGTGSGTVTSSLAGINCGTSCTASFSSGSQVTLTAVGDPGATFTGWSGACAGVDVCTLARDGAKNVTASFNSAQTFGLDVGKSGSGSGTVTSSPGSINCGSECSGSFNSGVQVTLTATAASGSTFAGWSGACAGTGSCVVTMDAA